MNKKTALPRLPKIKKDKIVIFLNQKNVRNIDFLKMFEKPRDIYLFSILLNHEIEKTIEKKDVIIEINELQQKYKNIRGESKYDLMIYLNNMNNSIFTNYILDKEKETLSYNIISEIYDQSDNTFFLNISLLKGLKINSQKNSFIHPKYGEICKLSSYFSHFKNIKY
ncbi:hypothetical protein [Photobacterium leiognathi]|uniref:hypothetical protein n=1 Tax=Photobacterium leiognathi TaxID=553611 RepID=UPI00298204BD|nr:hypothetical protein [Photobacterium leiognathi]